jgi:hypothetical protein
MFPPSRRGVILAVLSLLSFILLGLDLRSEFVGANARYKLFFEVSYKSHYPGSVLEGAQLFRVRNEFRHLVADSVSADVRYRITGVHGDLTNLVVTLSGDLASVNSSMDSIRHALISMSSLLPPREGSKCKSHLQIMDEMLLKMGSSNPSDEKVRLLESFASTTETDCRGEFMLRQSRGTWHIRNEPRLESENRNLLRYILSYLLVFFVVILSISKLIKHG